MGSLDFLVDIKLLWAARTVKRDIEKLGVEETKLGG
jgi:hypothetical protein